MRGFFLSKCYLSAMLPIPTAAQMRAADAHTIAHSGISSYDLMEQAATAFVAAFQRHFPERATRIVVVCGPGNNGGDGLAIARLLHQLYYTRLQIFLTRFEPQFSEDNQKNQGALEKIGVPITFLHSADDLRVNDADVVVDALLGTGLSREIEGEIGALVQKINEWALPVISVDVPTGFFSEGPMPKDFKGIKAYKSICFERPKINFLFPESQRATLDFEVVKIGLDEPFLRALTSDFLMLEDNDVRSSLTPRNQFAHKGSFGHACLVGGSAHMMGAALLAVGGALGVGAGKVSAAVPESGLPAMNMLHPEAIFLPRMELHAMEVLNRFDAVGIGCGLGQAPDVVQFMEVLLRSGKPLVVDADALNILANRPDLLDTLPRQSILTPHRNEFDRLFGPFDNWWDRVAHARKVAEERQWIIVLKNRYTFICPTDGKVYVNPTGHPAMAQGGMGDVLCGMITGFLAQGLSPFQAAAAGCYVHGLAGAQLAETSVVARPSVLVGVLPDILYKLIYN